ncbi:hypothetical protein NDU88_007631 [Pleurodeles waltl]|uniref:Uncharacterized protein n=1 Tax=Pleurodeles waltl TaxID=8319 RepID=A0AAV7VUZ7_PLEWA|nr:hypothetical protein NDU88_007631 [Pleurodeles waltl]
MQRRSAHTHVWAEGGSMGKGGRDRRVGERGTTGQGQLKESGKRGDRSALCGWAGDLLRSPGPLRKPPLMGRRCRGSPGELQKSWHLSGAIRYPPRKINPPTDS